MGHQEWADRQDRVCHIPSSHPEDHVPYPVPRTEERVTLVACIAADGSHLKPLIVIPRKTRDADLALAGFTAEKVTLYTQAKGRTGGPIFLAWLAEVILPEVRRRREAPGYAGRAVLILDNCAARAGPGVEAAYATGGFHACPLPPHSWSRTQPLDLPMDVVGTFAGAGITLTVTPEATVRCRVCPGRAGCLLAPAAPDDDPALASDELAGLDREPYLEHCSDRIEAEAAA